MSAEKKEDIEEMDAEEAAEAEDEEASDEDSSMDEEEDSNDDDDNDEEQLAKAVLLQQKLLENPYLYDCHKELIELYKSMGELDELREARQNMSKLYPLTEELWMQWIEDEKQLISTDEDRNTLLNLFEKAVKDYLSVNLWLEYCSFAIGCGDSSRCREIMSEALKLAGCHVTEGKLLWDLSIEYEKALLSAMQPAPGSCSTEEKQKQIQEQTDRIIDLYTRQLAVPLVGMASALQEFAEWAGQDKITSDIQSAYDEAASRLLICGKFESELDTVDTAELRNVVYRKYLVTLTSGQVKDTLCVNCLYERAVVNDCLTYDLWLKYTEYLEKNDDPSVLSIYARSVRNCPWSSALWVAYCRASEKRGEDVAHIKGLFETALQSGMTRSADYLEVWCAYLDLLRRNIDWTREVSEQSISELRQTFERSINHLLKFYGENGDPECCIPKYWAIIEGKYIKDMERARQIWNDTMTGWRKDKAEAWMELFNFERSYGDHKHCRRIFQRALKAVTDWPEIICTAYVRFEREEGSLDQLYTALARVKDIQAATAELRKVQAERNKPRSKFTKQTDGKFKKPNAKTAEQKTETKQQSTSLPDRKRSRDEMPPPPGKPAKSEFKMPSIPETEPASKKVKLETEKPVYRDKDPNTAFVSNLSFDVDEAKLRDIFRGCGEIKDIRVMKGKGDKSKGFAYVEFMNLEGAKSALKLDRQLIQQRPMLVSECDTKRDTTKKLKYDTGMEKTKLFVSSLAFSTTKGELESLFGKYGKLKDVRIVTYKGGNSKGLAYIEFCSEEEARQALLALDGYELNKYTMKVAISNPPPRREQVSAESKFVPSLGGASKQVSASQPRGKARTQLSLMPRAMLRKPETTTKPTTATTTTTAAAVTSSEGSSVKGMSNSDFRSMLLKK